MTSDTSIIIPAKEPDGAKSRLGDRLTPDQREALALALFQQALAFFGDLPGSHHVLVVTDSLRMQRIAEQAGTTVLFEEEATGETDAVNKATAWSLEQGYARQLVVPADMACWDEDEMQRLLATPIEPPRVVLCPATDDDGTNAILSCPPDVIPFRFGDASFPEYQLRARERGVDCRIMRLHSLVLDLDTPEDLARFMQLEHRGAVRDLVESWKLPVQ